MTTLFDTLKVGSLSVPSRIFMVTRPRCEFFDNKRPATSKYAGTSLETRSGFLKAVLKEVTEEVGAGRVGMRISPLNSYQDMNRGETAPDEVKFIASIANDFGLAYLHVMRADFFGQQKGDVITPARETLDGPALLSTWASRSTRPRRASRPGASMQSHSGPSSWPTPTCPHASPRAPT